MEQSLPLLCLSPTGQLLRRRSGRRTRNKIRKRIGRSRCPRWRGSVLTLVENLDRTLTVDGEPVSTEVGKTQRSGTTYVALVPMAKALDPAASAAWDAGSRTVTVTSGKLTLTAVVGQQYMVANGRYLYVPEGVGLTRNRVTVPCLL